MNVRDIKKTSTFFFPTWYKTHTHTLCIESFIYSWMHMKKNSTKKRPSFRHVPPHKGGGGSRERLFFSSLVRLGFKLWAEVSSVAIHGRGDVRQMTALVPQIEFFVLLQKQTPFASVLGRDEGFVVHVKPPLLINGCSGFLHVDTQPEKKHKKNIFECEKKI